jgi:uncharacterized protein YjbI with pentapeptide repeats
MGRKGLFAMLLGCVVAAGLFAAGPASAASRGYRLHNYINHDLKLQGATPVSNGSGVYNMDFEGRPKAGSVLRSEAQHEWELKWAFAQTYAAKLTYTINGTDGSVEFTIISSTFTNNSSCEITGVTGFFCRAEGLTLSLRKGGPKCLAPPANHVDWSGCDQRGAYLYYAPLNGARLEAVNLSDSYMNSVQADGADLRHANLQFAYLRDGQLRSAHLNDAKMDYAYLYSAELARAELPGADLTAANLTKASMRRVDLRGADMTFAILRDTDLSEARCNDQTVWPNGTKGHGETCPK